MESKSKEWVIKKRNKIKMHWEKKISNRRDNKFNS